MRIGRTGPSLGAIILLAIAVAALLGLDLPGGGDEGGDRAGRLGPEAEAEVLRVIDGDTIEVDLGGDEEDVRYIGIDTPESAIPGEPVECFGKEASAANERLVDGETVRLVFDAERRDRYGRLLAYVYAGDTFVNASLVEDGFATTLEIEPNTARAGQLGRLETAAGRAGAGLWGAC
ncbi:MAG TPA: thermonuclease family protein [Solirubrobacterales bacterium]